MYNGLLHAHSGFRYIVLVMIIVALVTAIKGRNNNTFTNGDKKIYLFTMISMHIQLLLGLILYFLNLAGKGNGKWVSFAEGFMKSPIERFYTIEHPLLMFLAIMIFTIGRKKAMKLDTPAAGQTRMLLLLVIVIGSLIFGIPWPGGDLPSNWF